MHSITKENLRPHRPSASKAAAGVISCDVFFGEANATLGDGEAGGLAGGAERAGCHGLDDGPRPGSALLEGGAGDAVKLAFRGARAGEGARGQGRGCGAGHGCGRAGDGGRGGGHRRGRDYGEGGREGGSDGRGESARSGG